jgi:NAD(P)-dependent dehydrogenase (short-subunit alcohol dehydrogenase family)
MKESWHLSTPPPGAPLGRAGQVSDVVDGVLFLESSPYITGEILHIDGGQVAGH